MSSQADTGGPHCGVLGCTDPAEVVIRHPEHGDLTVCSDCTGGYVVIHHV